MLPQHKIKYYFRIQTQYYVNILVNKTDQLFLEKRKQNTA